MLPHPLDIPIIAFELIGLFVTLYLIYKNAKKKDPVCFIGHRCDVVLQSKYSRFLGIKLEVIGLLFYSLMLSLFLTKIFFPIYSYNILMVFAIMTTAGVVVSTILTFIQTRILKSLCSWCLVSATSNFLVFILMLFYMNSL